MKCVSFLSEQFDSVDDFAEHAIKICTNADMQKFWVENEQILEANCFWKEKLLFLYFL